MKVSLAKDSPGETLSSKQIFKEQYLFDANNTFNRKKTRFRCEGNQSGRKLKL
jgi:hypothetical protein